MIKFTDQAASRFNKVVEENPDLGSAAFRVFVKGSGCAGFEYGFEFATEFTDDDMFFESLGGKIVVDPISYQYLQGSEIEFKKELMGEYFTLINPNVTSSCGCGKSFSIG